MAKKNTAADRVQQLYQAANSGHRRQWEYMNQKGYDFANDNQMSRDEKNKLEDQGMPTFTINRIIPIVEMLNYYATANNPRWQAVGVEGSDSDVAAVFSDLSDYIWARSNGTTLYSNVINDAITKSVGYMMVSVDPNADNGMGEVKLSQPDPFDIFVDQKSRDVLFRDASYIMIRKVLPKEHIKKLYPEHARKINNVSGKWSSEASLSEKAYDKDQKDFHYKDITQGLQPDGNEDELIELFEVYEKESIKHVKVSYLIPTPPKELEEIKQQVAEQYEDLQAEMSVQLDEQLAKMQQAYQAGQMQESRFLLEKEKAQEMTEQQLASAKKEIEQKLKEAAQTYETTIMSEKAFKKAMEDPEFQSMVQDVIPFFKELVKMTVVAGDKTLFSQTLPITEYPIVPFHYKWTGTPYPMSAVSPLVGKQQELNKAHQLMVHNASLGSSLRWMYYKGSIDEEYWEKFATAPGALLPVNHGYENPKEVMPAQLSNAFFGIVQEGKGDMEYLAGIYSSMQGDIASSKDMPYRGLLAMDEYGTRRIKQWLQASIEPALQQLGKVICEISQFVYTAEKRFRIIQPSALQEEKEQHINIPIYNDMGKAIGKSMDYSAAKFDVRIVTGSTLPMNRWAYLGELKELLSAGVVDDIAVLAETDIRNKEKIAERKSMYSQMRSQMGQMEEAIKDKDGTIETLERQLVQAGIKMKVMAADVEINKEKERARAQIETGKGKVQTEMEAARQNIKKEEQSAKRELGREGHIKAGQLELEKQRRILEDEAQRLQEKEKNLENRNNQ